METESFSQSNSLLYVIHLLCSLLDRLKHALVITMNFITTIQKIYSLFSEENSLLVHYSSTPGMNLLQICFLQRIKATSKQFQISTASPACQTTTQVLKMLFNMHLYARAQMTILKTEFLASQTSSTDSQCWVSKRVGARRMTL